MEQILEWLGWVAEEECALAQTRMSIVSQPVTVVKLFRHGTISIKKTSVFYLYPRRMVPLWAWRGDEKEWRMTWLGHGWGVAGWLSKTTRITTITWPNPNFHSHRYSTSQSSPPITWNKRLLLLLLLSTLQFPFPAHLVSAFPALASNPAYLPFRLHDSRLITLIIIQWQIFLKSQ